MSRYKFYTRGLSLMILTSTLLPLTANAGILKKAAQCWELLTAEPAIRQAETRTDRAEFEQFMRINRNNSHATPPVKLFTADTPVKDLLLSFPFWWYEGNIFHFEMLERFSEVANTVIEQQGLTGLVPPRPDSLPTPQALIAEEAEAYAETLTNDRFPPVQLEDIRQAYEELKAQLAGIPEVTVVQIKNQKLEEVPVLRPNEEDYQKFMADLKKNPATEPPVQIYTLGTSQEELLYGLAFWWFEGNLWYDAIQPKFKSLAETMHEQQEEAGPELPALSSLPARETLSLPIEAKPDRIDVFPPLTAEDVLNEIKRMKEEEARDDQISANSGNSADTSESTSFVHADVPTPQADTSLNAGTDGPNGPAATGMQ